MRGAPEEATTVGGNEDDGLIISISILILLSRKSIGYGSKVHVFTAINS